MVPQGCQRREPDAQGKLGFLYASGQGVPQDYGQAHMWYNLAVANAVDAQTRASAIKGREEIAAKMTPAQIAEAQKMAREWVPKCISA